MEEESPNWIKRINLNEFLYEKGGFNERKT